MKKEVQVRIFQKTFFGEKENLRSFSYFDIWRMIPVFNTGSAGSILVTTLSTTSLEPTTGNGLKSLESSQEEEYEDEEEEAESLDKQCELNFAC